MRVLEVVQDQQRLVPGRERALAAGDCLIVAETDTDPFLEALGQLNPEPEARLGPVDLETADTGLAELVLAPRSVIGR